MPERPRKAKYIIKAGWLFQGLLLLSSFLCGVSFGMHLKGTGPATSDCWNEDDPRLLQFLKQKLREQSKTSLKGLRSGEREQTFPREMGGFLTGMSRVDRNNFAKKFDMGVPLDESKSNNKEVLILYSHNNALPSSNLFDQAQAKGLQMPLISSTEEATENCDNLHVVLTQPSRSRQCLAIMGQYESFHLQKWMRLPEGRGEGVDRRLPLRLVNRGAQASGRVSTPIPTKEITMQHWTDLSAYLDSIPKILDDLEPIAKKVAKDNTVVVMVCNMGQADLLRNFACNARAKGFDLSSVLVFATDKETAKLAESLNLATYFNDFGGMPKEAAKQYGDMTFRKMMLAKVYCVQLVSLLGYDVLFQDVDVIWYQEPIKFFHNATSGDDDIDMYFQDDGNHAVYYAPYSANTGFYFVRNNDKTRHFFNSLLMAGDLIISTHSHQIALISLLSEHASLYGLRTKVFERNSDIFPGGYSFHRKKEFMKDVLEGRIKPLIFHMSWTSNKDNKKKFYQQMGEWYSDEHCEALGSDCCLKEAKITCHYRDKPSKVSCQDYPPIDKGKPSFW